MFNLGAGEKNGNTAQAGAQNDRPPKGGAPPSRSHPAASGLPSPQGLRPSAASGLTPQMERLRRCGLGEPGASAWQKAVSSRACEGAKPPHTPQPGRASSTACAILKHRGDSTAAGFTPRKGSGWLAGGAGTPLKCQRNVRRGARPAPITSRVRSESRGAPGATCRRRASGRSAPGRA